MKQIFIILAFVISYSYSLNAKIVTTSHAQDALPYIDAETWVLVDFDNTLFEAKQAYGHNFWFLDQKLLRMKNGMTEEQAVLDFYPHWVQAQQVCPVKPLEKSFIPLLKELQNKKIVIIGLTNRWEEIVDSTLRQIESLDIDFSQTAPCSKNLVLQCSQKALYKKGILFTCKGNNKKEVFLSFLKNIQKKPKKVLFFDDMKKNIEDLEGLVKEKIDYTGILYTAIQESPAIYSRELADIQWHYHNTILSNEDAQKLLKKN
jgi:FMN phosphatase YigB (HAD superfamily)